MYIAVVWHELLLALGCGLVVVGVVLAFVKGTRAGLAPAGLGILALLVGGFLYFAPREDVPTPTKSASPELVVRAYIDAINARDYSTSNAIYPQSSHGFFSRPERIDLKSIDRVKGDRKERATVYYTADFSGGDGSLEGLEKWGYELARTSDGRWFITSQGLI